jgi:hypothetical protein
MQYIGAHRLVEAYHYNLVFDALSGTFKSLPQTKSVETLLINQYIQIVAALKIPVFLCGEGTLRPSMHPTGCKSHLVTVVGRLVWTTDGKIEIFGLLWGERSELDAQLGDMSTSNFLVETFGQHMHTKWEIFWGRPERDLGQNLVGERT